ncbi:hypothetical protein K431DRAFT_278310 [Polychaeton citri CBS 116435]|uniref:Uncharacterized protein n=1 Tax=Polychaeton citri CBS 116435 TaxID=1314669 RepID=A0A9P4PZP5_9PEZI|nr:hypothetical protein K431DRAFT_278310 [Polychaeton citri CBS 116435]
MLRLQAPASFSLVNTQLLSEGPYAGHQAIIICPAKSFPFLELPAEVRCRVYRFYFANNGVVGKGIALDNKRKEGKRMFAKFFIEGVKNRVGLLAVNKQLYNEAAPVLYSHVLSFADTSSVMEFMLDMSPRSRELLQYVNVKTYVKTTSRNAMNTLADAVNLKRLRIFQSVSTESEPAKAAKALYTDMYKLLESIGRKLGDKRAAVDVLSFGREAFKFKDKEKKETLYTTEMILEVKEALKDRVSA